MTTIITVLITLYFVYNIKLAYEFKSFLFEKYNNPINKLKIIVLLIFGGIYHFNKIILLLYHEISSFFQLEFLYLYYFTNKFKNMDKKELDRINHLFKNFYPKNLRGKIIHKSVKMINKLNGYETKKNKV